MLIGVGNFFIHLQERLVERVGRGLLLALAVLVAAGAANAQQTSVRGRVAVTWADPPVGQPELVLHLVDAQGQTSRLELPPHLRTDIGAQLRLDRALVEVQGELSVTESGGRRLRVGGLQPLVLESESLVLADARGNGPWAVLLCRFPDVASTPHPVSWYESLFGANAPGLVDFWNEVSFGRHDVSGTQVLGWMDLPLPRDAYFNGSSPDLNALFQDCTGVADPDLDFGTVTGIHMAFNSDLGGYAWGGSAWITRDGLAAFYPTTWMPTWADHKTYAHEMGHGLGMPHSSGPYSQIYDSRWDVMSGGYGGNSGTYGRIAMHTIAFHKDLLGWIPPQVKLQPNPDSRSTVRLAHLAEDALGGEYSMVEIPLPDGEFYTVEARRDYGYDGPPYEAVVLHRVDPDRSNGVPANVVDLDGNGNPNDGGAAWLPGETFKDTQNGVRVSVVSQTSSGFEVEIEVGNPGTDPQPLIALTPTTLTYETTEGTNPLDKSFTVKNDGGGTLDYTVSSNRNWLGVSRTSGSLGAGATHSVTVSVDASGLVVGTQSGTITVGGNGTNAPQTVAVSVTVNEQPVAPSIAVAPTSLTYETTEGSNPPDKSFTVKNDGGGTLDYTASSNRNWLGLSRSSGSLAAGASHEVSVSVDASSRPVGTSSGTITIGGNGDNAPQTVAVSVTITEQPSGPRIAVGPSSLDFQIKGKKAPGPQKLGLQNSGSQDLNWNANSNQPWLILGESSGTLATGSTDSLSVEVSLTGLDPGTYDATIEVAGNADNSPQSVAVQLKLTKGGVVKLKKGRLTFAGSTEEEPLAAYVLLENDGDASAEWSASADQEWLELDLTSGSLAAGSSVALSLQAQVAGLVPGMFSGSIEFAGGDDELPDTLRVELMVTDGPGVRHPPEQAAAHLLGAGASLGSDELDYIDFVGNGNGRFDVGDLRAWLIQAGKLGADAPLLSLEAAYASQLESTSEGLPAVSRESAERRD